MTTKQLVQSIVSKPVTVRFLPSEAAKLDRLVEHYQKIFPHNRATKSDLIRIAVMEMADRELPKDK